MAFEESTLYMMSQSEDDFRAGTWMEHKMFGGVITPLTGVYYTIESDSAGSNIVMTECVYFKIVTMTARDILQYNETVQCNDLFAKMEGYMYNQSTRAFGPLVTIFHADKFRRCCRDLNNFWYYFTFSNPCWGVDLHPW